jgi:hypothetical protein
MVREKVNYAVVVFLLLSIAGCTVTKRHFGSGYHVEWKKSHQFEKNSERKQNKESQIQESLARTEITQKRVDAVQEMQINEDSSEKSNVTKSDLIEKFQFEKQHFRPSKINDSDYNVEIENKKIATRNSLSIEKKQPEDVIDTTRKTDVLTWVSLSLFLATLIYGTYFWLSYVYGILYLTFLGYSGILFGLAVVFFVISLISAIRVTKYPEKYKNKALTIVLFAFSTLLFVTALLFFGIGLYIDSGPGF